LECYSTAARTVTKPRTIAPNSPIAAWVMNALHLVHLSDAGLSGAAG
jgi:hypothetical protein